MRGASCVMGGLKHDARQRVRQLYAGLGLRNRLYVRLRSSYYPLEIYDQHLPTQGRIADIGCGDGVLGGLIALLRPQAKVIGFEPEAARRERAALAANALENFEVRAGGWEALEPEGFAGALLVDTLHHVPYPEQAAALGRLAGALAPGGVALVSETDPSQWLRSRWNYLSDVLLYPGQTRCCFRQPAAMRQLLEQAGFSVQTVPLPPRLGFAIILYVATKRASS